MLLALALAVCAACSRSAPTGAPPEPRAVHPVRGVGLQPTRVVIEGDAFQPVAVRRLSGGEPVELDARFQALLGDVPLQDVAWRDEHHLEALVPAGVDPGLHPLTVIAPLGARGTLEAAFEVSAEPFARLAIEPQPGRDALAPTEDAAVSAALVNAGDAALRDVSASLVQEGEGRVEVVASPAVPAQLDGGARASLAWTVRGRTPGPVQLSLEARGVDTESGLEVRARAALPPLRVLAPAVLGASLALQRASLNVGDDGSLALTLTNGGELAALDVQPGVPALEGGAALTLRSGPDAAGFTLEAGAQRTVHYVLRAQSAGSAQVRVGASAREAGSGAALSAQSAAAPLAVLRPAALAATFALPGSVSVGQDFEVALDVTNTGESSAAALQPAATASSGAVVLGAPPEAQEVPGGQTLRFVWTAHASAAGQSTFGATGTAVDGTNGAGVALAAGPSAPLRVQAPPALTASLTLPAAVNTGDSFDVVLTVANGGEAGATQVQPAGFVVSAPGLVTQLSAPPGGGVALAGGAATTFVWSFRAVAEGSVRFSASASGLDANSGAAVSSAPAGSSPVGIGLVRELAVDPFGDGTAFSFVAAYGGRVLLGPSRSGTGAVAMNPDGTGAQSLAFTFPKDPGTGRSSSNKAVAPYPSIGATGCAKDTAACGPDNEDGRGLFFSGVAGGAELLGVAGGRSVGDWNYVYLTRDPGSPLRFSFVDLSNAPPGPATRGISSARFFNNQLYLGLPDDGGSRPYFIQLRTFPPGPGGGLDAAKTTDALNLELDRTPDFGVNGSPKNPASMVGVDALQGFAAPGFAQRLYLANNGAWLRTTVADPRPYPAAPGDWANITPSAAAFAAHASVQLARAADLEPDEKAVPFFAVLQGRLYAARNTTAGPQLWVCNPAFSAPAADCDAGDWSLLAPNTSGTLTLSQFNAPANARVTLLAASATRLYVGFNNAGGAVVYASTTGAPATAADFVGQGGCSAALGPAACPGLGGNGLGAGAQRLYDSALLSSGGRDFLFLTAGSSGGAVRVFRLAE